MRKILVFKHLAQENLGALKPVLQEYGFRVRYVNFGREPDAQPSLAGYRGLIVLGGWMGVYEAEQYPHLRYEFQLIESALREGLPVLGICLGAQILAHVLGGEVKRHVQRETGWREIRLTEEGEKDPLFSHFRSGDRVFQMHGDTFSLPIGAQLLARSEVCENQAFRFGEKAYGLQFHLEADQFMLQKFFREERATFDGFAGEGEGARLEKETPLYLSRSLELAQKTFFGFLQGFGLPLRQSRSFHGRGMGRS